MQSIWIGDMYEQLKVARVLVFQANEFPATETFSFLFVAATRWSLGMTTVSNDKFALFREPRLF